MFDNKNTKEPEDIFGGMDKSASSAGIPQSPQKPLISQPRPPQPALLGGERVMLEEPKKSWIKLLVLVAAGIIVVLGVAGWVFFRGYFLKSQQVKPDIKEQASEEQQEAGEMFPKPSSEVAEEEQEQDIPVDTDGDGLTDDEELMLGIDPNLVDTDGDQLSDKDEVKVYKTDPLNPDTDGDTFLDGEEVKNGYDPKGRGKLFEVPAPENQ